MTPEETLVYKHEHLIGFDHAKPGTDRTVETILVTGNDVEQVTENLLELYNKHNFNTPPTTIPVKHKHKPTRAQETRRLANRLRSPYKELLLEEANKEEQEEGKKKENRINQNNNDNCIISNCNNPINVDLYYCDQCYIERGQ